MDEKIKALVIEPQKPPCVQEIGSDLKSLQEAVGGYIEAVYPYEEPAALIVNEEGKLEGLPLNRSLRDDDGNVFDISAGTMLVVGLGDETFCSLTEDQIQRFTEEFRIPEQFIRLNGHILSIPMEEPAEEQNKQEVPVYRESADYAGSQGQLKAYRESVRLNADCARAIEAAIQDNYRDNRLNPAGAVKVAEQFGQERVQYVLASTIREMTWDGRFSPENKAWAYTVPGCEGGKDVGNREEFLVSQTHPGLVNLFTTQIRRLDREHSKDRTSVREQLREKPRAPAVHRKHNHEPER